MSSDLDKFRICDKIPEELKQEIIIFHVFDDCNATNIIFITKNDRVYGTGSNHFGSLGLAHNRGVE